jgi:alpha-glucosidase (family GH31 glycosyl hydrolase)
MLGDRILVAPVLQKGQRKRRVIFPPGTWRGDDGSTVAGPTQQDVEAPLARLPWYRLESP